MSRESLSLLDVAGIGIHTGSMNAAVEAVLERARKRLPGYVCIANADVLTRARRTGTFMAVVRAAVLTFADGMPLVWVAKGKARHTVERVSGPELVYLVCRKAAEEGLKVFVVGGAPAEVEGFSRRTASEFGGFELAGVYAPEGISSTPAFDQVAVEEIRRSDASIVLVCLGCPKQENWSSVHSAHIRAPLLCVGYALAVIGGTVKRAPAWMQAAGLEWFWRLMAEPSRLWRRYLVGNTLFLWYVAGDLVGSIFRIRKSGP